MMPTALEQEQLVSTGEGDVRQYLSEIRAFPRLSPDEERELAKRCVMGDEDAIRQMVNSNLRLVVSVAREYAGRGVPLLDLIQEGSFGLLEAARKFDYTLEYRFSTYATKWIRQGVTRCLLNRGVIRVPLHTAEDMRKVDYARNRLIQQTGEEPDVSSVAEECGFTPEKVTKLLFLSPEICSLDTETGPDGDTALASFLEDPNSAAPYKELVRRELDQTMQQLLGLLKPRQRQVLQLHYGYENGICHSFEEIGRELGVSKERARQIEKESMQKLRKLGADLGLEDFLND